MQDADAKALMSQSLAALGRGDHGLARQLIDRAAAAAPADLDIALNKALVRRAGGNLPEAMQAIEDALAIDPYSLLGLLSKGALLEQMGRPREGARVFRNALRIAPPDTVLPASLQPIIAHARTAVARHTEELNAFLRTYTEQERRAHAGSDLNRFDECLDILSGAKKAFVQEPLLLTFPKLPPITFHDRAHFPWMAALEAQTDIIRDELIVQLKAYWSKFKPYIQYPPGSPVNQWEALNHSPDWSTLHLWRDGRRIAENCALFPRTTAILETVPMADQPGFAPTAMISVLQPRTRIPPHTGSANVRLIAHLPLIIPENCGFRVGNDTRPWIPGECFVFDDTIEHEAWNDSDQLRAVLIFDVWNPFLTEAERRLVTVLMDGLNAYDSAG